MKSLFLALALVFAAPNLAPPALALQGAGIGTLPTATRNVGWLTPHQTIELRSGEVRMVIGSSHNNDADVMPPPPPPDEPQILRHNWTWNGVNVEVKTPRLANENGPAGEERWQQRHAEAVHKALQKWPRDA